MTVIAFDLDGTISDPVDGITASINYALEKLGLATKNKSELLKFIGPGLTNIFQELLENPSETEIEHAVGLYRERYGETGYRENTLYEGVVDVLLQLSEKRIPLYIATAKRQDMAEAVIEHFDLNKFFKKIYGCGSSRRKEELLGDILKDEPSASELYMIGDRSHDMLAGQRVSATCIGVLWGYGTRKELVNSGASKLANKPEELLNLCIP